MTTSQSCQEGHCWCTLNTAGQRSCCRCGTRHTWSCSSDYRRRVPPACTPDGLDGRNAQKAWLHGYDSASTGPADLIPIYELQQRQDAERIATLTKELERLKGQQPKPLISFSDDAKRAIALTVRAEHAESKLADLTKRMEAQATGRRRCGIREHRKQIRGLQKQLAFTTRELTVRAERAEAKLAILRSALDTRLTNARP